MRVKTSITLSEETLAAVDRAATDGVSRSSVIETAVLDFLARRDRQAREERDIAIINAHADELNAEMADVLELQAAWSEWDGQ